MRFNSKALGILTVLFVIFAVISATNAVDSVNDFSNNNFKIDMPSGCDFSQNATSKVNVGEVSVDMTVFENTGDNSKEVSSITYLKDSSANKSVASGFINDIKKNGKIVEEKDKYIVVKTLNSTNFNFSASDIEKGIDDVMGFANEVFSSGDLKFSADGDTVSFSNKGLEISDSNGTNVSVSSDGIKVVDGENSSNNADVSFNSNISTEFLDSDYVVCLENQNNSQLIIISGNDLESLKAMADTASFKGN